MVLIGPVGLTTGATSDRQAVYHEEQVALRNYESLVFNDLLNGYTGPSYNLDEEYYSGLIMPLAWDNRNKCDDHCPSHGPGVRIDGGTGLLSSGCRNYMGWSYGNYGATDIPFWINMTSMNTITNTTHRKQLIDDLRNQAALWNQAIMHDGTGQIVNLYETGVGSATRPANIDGRRVVEVVRLDGDYAGRFIPSDLQILINYSATGGGEQGRNVDTPLHEMGHVLGLYDLESDGSGITHGTHKTLMAYERDTTRETINSAIKYQDIQGIAVLNNRHTCSNANFMRYITSGNNRMHICFYCDRIDSRTTIISGSQAMADSATCTHDYQQMVSHAERHWLKCTKCYKVVESNFKVKSLTSTTLEVTGLININKTSITIPSTIGGQAVTSIGSNAFANCTSLTNVTLPNSLTTIENSAFNGCSSLSSIIIPSTVTRIGTGAFRNCSNLSIYITGMTTVPNGWNNYWNPSDRPIYFNGILHTHNNEGREFTGNHYHGIKKVHYYEYRFYCTQCKYTIETKYQTEQCDGPPCPTLYSLPPLSEVYHSDSHSPHDELPNPFNNTTVVYLLPKNEYLEIMFIQ